MRGDLADTRGASSRRPPPCKPRRALWPTRLGRARGHHSRPAAALLLAAPAATIHSPLPPPPPAHTCCLQCPHRAHASMVSLADILTVVSCLLCGGFSGLIANDNGGLGSEVGAAMAYSWFAGQIIQYYVKKHSKPNSDPWNLGVPWATLDATIKVLNVAIALVLAEVGTGGSTVRAWLFAMLFLLCGGSGVEVPRCARLVALSAGVLRASRLDTIALSPPPPRLRAVRRAYEACWQRSLLAPLLPDPLPLRRGKRS